MITNTMWWTIGAIACVTVQSAKDKDSRELYSQQEIKQRVAELYKTAEKVNGYTRLTYDIPMETKYLGGKWPFSFVKNGDLNGPLEYVTYHLNAVFREAFRSHREISKSDWKQDKDTPEYFFHGGFSPEKSPGGNLWTEVAFDRCLCWPAVSALKVHGQTRKAPPLTKEGEYIGYMTVYKLNPAFYHKGGKVSMKIHNESDCPPGTCGDWSIGARLGYSFGGVHKSYTLPDAYILSKECRKNAGLKPFLVLRIRNPLYKPSAPQAKWQWRKSENVWMDYSGEHSAALEHHFQTYVKAWCPNYKWPELCLKYKSASGERNIKVYRSPKYLALVQERQGDDGWYGQARQVRRVQ